MNAKVENTLVLADTKKFGTLDIRVYENPAVDHSRVQDDFWMTREQIGTALEYSNPMTAIKNIHNRNTTRLDPLSTQLKMSQVEGKRTVTREVVCYNLRGVMEICRYSTQPKADAFMDFCWDVIAALMRGETVSLKVNQAELKRQERFDKMTQVLTEIHSKMDALEAARQQDRNALDNVLFVCKQLERKLNATNQPPKPPEQTATTATVAAKETHSTTYKGRSEWRTEIYKLGNSIARMSGSTLNAVLKQAYDYIGRNYGWYFKDERRMYVERVGYKGDIKNLSGLDIIEDSETWKSIFMSIMKDRYENEKHDAEARKGIKSALTKKPPMIPADMIPTRHRVEPAPEVVAEEPAPVVVAEAHAVEIETPAVETPAVETPAVDEPKKESRRCNTKVKSITFPIVEPIAKKLGDKTVGCWITYAKIYDTIGVVKMDRMRKAYVRSHNKPPKCTPDIFQYSDKNMKVFKEAAKIVAASI